MFQALAGTEYFGNDRAKRSVLQAILKNDGDCRGKRLTLRAVSGMIVIMSCRDHRSLLRRRQKLQSLKMQPTWP